VNQQTRIISTNSTDIRTEKNTAVERWPNPSRQIVRHERKLYIVEFKRNRRDVIAGGVLVLLLCNRLGSLHGINQ